jgi:hypothetical protein
MAKRRRSRIRQRCYDEVVACVRDGLARYYLEFGDRLGDQRAADAVEWSLRGLERILEILDEYGITELPVKPKDGKS